jgi:hydrogenase maturation protein HypF
MSLVTLTECLTRINITITGAVQGVGFRPFVFHLAEQLGVQGWVRNNSSGVEIEAEGEAETLHAFVQALRDQAPPLARIEHLRVSEIEPVGQQGFAIRPSERQETSYQLVSPDIATCPDCLRELFDPADRRYLYPFINCTNCGPRFTIIADIPYDRENTTMRAFRMCADCQREYDDPRDRRFHAQPNACPACGPRLELLDSRTGQQAALDGAGHGDALDRAVALLRQGAILAIKGLGGFHLACDATNAEAVQTLRARKRRPDKPFAVMMPTLAMARQHCDIGPEEERLLTSPQCPIVLLRWRDSSDVARNVAPRYRYLGVMLPYTPLHHVLLRDVDRPLVMTSGNLSEEPIAAENQEALERLGLLADALLMHDRDIYARYDDSVWFVPALRTLSEATGQQPAYGHAQPVRRARGYAPFPIKLPAPIPQVLACGAELKNTFCLTRDEYAFVSQHIGDMENLETLEHFERTVALYQQLFRIHPQIVAHDLHPDSMATRYAQRQAASLGLPCVAVQHHHAHIAACLTDNGWSPDQGPVIGVALDGVGYGQDGHIWGGEWFLADYRGYRRLGHLENLPLPGGDAATRNPWRIALGYCYALFGQMPEIAWLQAITEDMLGIVRQQVDRRLNCPQTSSMGRLFDAVAALLGVCQKSSYEAQAAIELEMLALSVGSDPEGREYPVQIDAQENGHMVVRVAGLLQAIMSDLRAGLPVAAIAWRFHQAIAEVTAKLCARIAEQIGVRVAELSGGCWQNRLLLSMTAPRLRAAGLDVLVHREVPCNDGGLSLGQAMIAHFSS